MIIGLDSATPPTPAQAQAARAAGVGLWSGYLATRGGVGLLRAWTQAEFETARICGGTPIAFCSGNDDPAGCRALAAAWNVRLCLDVEGGIRGDGPWVQPWLDASSAGLYGNAPVFANRRAPFYVLAGYPGVDPRNTWSNAVRPPRPCGWQWQGTHGEFGASVDRGWYDDWFGGTERMTLDDKRALVDLAYDDALGRDPESPGSRDYWANQIADDGSNTEAVIAKILDSPEGLSHKAAIAKLIALLPQLQSLASTPPAATGQVPPHQHSGTVTVH